MQHTKHWKYGTHDAAREKILLRHSLISDILSFSSLSPPFLTSFLPSLSPSYLPSLPFLFVPQVLKWRKSQRHSTQRTYSYLRPLKLSTCGKVTVTVILMLTLPSCSLPCLVRFYSSQSHHPTLSTQSWYHDDYENECVCVRTLIVHGLRELLVTLKFAHLNFYSYFIFFLSSISRTCHVHVHYLFYFPSFSHYHFSPSPSLFAYLPIWST